MTTFTATIVYRGAVPGPVKPSEWNDFIRETFREMGNHWHANMRRKHFTRAGATEYNYAPREGERGNIPEEGFRASYTGQKLRRFGHTRPLVKTGESEKATRRRDVRATAKKRRARVEVHLHAPRLNWRNPHSNAHPSKEVKTISGGEKKKLRDVGAKQYRREVRAYSKKKTKKVG